MSDTKGQVLVRDVMVRVLRSEARTVARHNLIMNGGDTQHFPSIGPLHETWIMGTVHYVSPENNSQPVRDFLEEERIIVIRTQAPEQNFPDDAIVEFPQLRVSYKSRKMEFHGIDPRNPEMIPGTREYQERLWSATRAAAGGPCLQPAKPCPE